MLPRVKGFSLLVQTLKDTKFFYTCTFSFSPLRPELPPIPTLWTTLRHGLADYRIRVFVHRRPFSQVPHESEAAASSFLIQEFQRIDSVLASIQ